MAAIDGKRCWGAVSRAALVAAAAAAMSLASAAWAFAAGDTNQAACPAITEAWPGFRMSLPDCRAYEIVSEANTSDTSNITGSYGFPDGEHTFYKAFLPIPGAGTHTGSGYEQFLATRTASGWQDTTVSPIQGEGPTKLPLAAQQSAEGATFTRDFSQAFVRSPFRDPFEEPQLNQTTGMGAYSLSLASGMQTFLSLPDSGPLTQSLIESQSAYQTQARLTDWGAFLVGVASDGSRVFFVTTAKLATAPGTPVDTHEASNEIYERMGGHTYLVGVLPDGSVPGCGAEVGQGVGSTVESFTYWSYGAVAPSGANVVFSTPAPNVLGASEPCNERGLYLRDVVHGTTVRLPGLLYGGRAGTGPGEEEKVFTFEPGTGEIFEYHVTSGVSSEIGVGSLLAWSRDGSRVYFLGEEEGVYLYEAGETKPIPGTQVGGYRVGVESRRGGSIENHIRTETPAGNTRNMPVASAGGSDGSHLLFIDSTKLTKYENEEHQEAYIYDAETGNVRCISCNLHNKPPEVPRLRENDAQLVDEFSTDVGEELYQNPSPPFISADGSQAVFETTEGLVPQDTNGTMDVYEWALEGSDGCTAESATYSKVIEGCVYLLSSGLGSEGPFPFNGVTSGTHLVGATEGLQNVYVQTPETLLPGLDNASHVYDIRINGGFPYTPPGEPGCEAGLCKTGSGEASMFGEPASEVLEGAMNAKPGVQHKSAGSSRRRLVRALKACRRKHGKRRRRCETRARARFAASKSSIVRLNGGSK